MTSDTYCSTQAVRSDSKCLGLDISESDKLLLEGPDFDTVVCDLRYPRQAYALREWNHVQPDLSNVVKTAVLRAWILWPRLRSKSWKHDTARITISTHDERSFAISLQLEGHSQAFSYRLGQNVSPNLSSLPDFLTQDSCELLDCDAEKGHDMCTCSVIDMLKEAKLDVEAMQTLNRQSFTALEIAEFVAHMMCEYHSKRLRSHSSMQGSVDTSGRQWNSCVKCRRSRIFLCDHTINLDGETAANGVTLGLDAGVEVASGAAPDDSDGEPSAAVEFRPGMQSTDLTSSTTLRWDSSTTRAFLDRPEAYDPYRWDRPYST